MDREVFSGDLREVTVPAQPETKVTNGGRTSFGSTGVCGSERELTNASRAGVFIEMEARVRVFVV